MQQNMMHHALALEQLEKTRQAVKALALLEAQGSAIPTLLMADVSRYSKYC